MTVISATITESDIKLSKALLPDLSLEVIAEKLEVPVYDLAYRVLDCDFKMPSKLFLLRHSKAQIRFGEDSIERYCTRCKDYFPFLLEYWHVATRSKDGASSMCRACATERRLNDTKHLYLFAEANIHFM